MSEESIEETSGDAPETEGSPKVVETPEVVVEQSELSKAAAMKAFLESDDESSVPAVPTFAEIPEVEERVEEEPVSSPASLEEEEDEDPETKLQLRPVPEDGIRRRWYAVHAHSGKESNVSEMLLQGAESLGMADMVCHVHL